MDTTEKTEYAVVGGQSDNNTDNKYLNFVGGQSDNNTDNKYLNFVLNGQEVIIKIEDESSPQNDVKDIPKSFSWNDSNTATFLQFYKEQEQLFKAGTLKTVKLIWQNISALMKQQGHFVSPVQVENKYKTLKRAYKKMINSNKKPGRIRRACPYEAQLNEILQNKHEIESVSETCSELAKPSTNQFSTPKKLLSNVNRINTFREKHFSRKRKVQEDRIGKKLEKIQNSIDNATSKIDIYLGKQLDVMENIQATLRQIQEQNKMFIQDMKTYRLKELRILRQRKFK